MSSETALLRSHHASAWAVPGVVSRRTAPAMLLIAPVAVQVWSASTTWTLAFGAEPLSDATQLDSPTVLASPPLPEISVKPVPSLAGVVAVLNSASASAARMMPATAPTAFGVPVRRVLISVYAISGALAGLGGLILTGQLDSGDPKLGRMYELEVITAVVVGGASLMGGEGRVLGTLIGALIIAVIKNGMNQMRIDPFDQEIVLGSVLLATVLLDTLRHRRGSRSVGASAT